MRVCVCNGCFATQDVIMVLFFLKREIGLSADLCMLSRFLVLVVLARNLICIRLMELQI